MEVRGGPLLPQPGKDPQPTLGRSSTPPIDTSLTDIPIDISILVIRSIYGEGTWVGTVSLVATLPPIPFIFPIETKKEVLVSSSPGYLTDIIGYQYSVKNIVSIRRWCGNS